MESSFFLKKIEDMYECFFNTKGIGNGDLTNSIVYEYNNLLSEKTLFSIQHFYQKNPEYINIIKSKINKINDNIWVQSIILFFVWALFKKYHTILNSQSISAKYFVEVATIFGISCERYINI